MTRTEYKYYLNGVACDMELAYEDILHAVDPVEWLSKRVRESRENPNDYPLWKYLGWLEDCWHKKHQLPWTAPLFTLDTPVEAVLDYWLDKGLDL